MAAVISVGLRALIPPWALTWLAQDDALQVTLANSLENGQWLGEWNNLTFAKGPGYPLFLAAIHGSGLPPTVATQLLYLAGAAILAFGTWLWLRKPPVSAALFVVLAFNPVMFGSGGSRVYREGFTAALAVAVLGLTVVLAYLCANRQRKPRWFVSFLLAACATGLAVAWLTITRVDTIWVMFTAGIFVFFAIFLSTSTWRERGARILIMLVAATPMVAIVIATQQTIAQQNYERYGVSVVEDYTSGPYADASKRWASVVAGQPRASVPVTKAQRLAVYSVSPTAKLLEPYLETPPATVQDRGWKSENCRQTGICDEAGPWFAWMLRDAAVQTGTANTPVEFEEFFARISGDIVDACNNGALSCGPPGLAPGFPTLDQVEKVRVFRNFVTVFTQHLGFVSADSPMHIGAWEPEQVDLWLAAVNGIAYQSEPPAGQLGIASMAPIVQVLKVAYVTAAILLLVPAIIGLVWSILTAGILRAAGALGIAALGGAVLHSAILGLMFSALASWKPGLLDSYSMESEPYLLVALCTGVWGFAVLIQRTFTIGGSASNESTKLPATDDVRTPDEQPGLAT